MFYESIVEVAILVGASYVAYRIGKSKGASAGYFALAKIRRAMGEWHLGYRIGVCKEIGADLKGLPPQVRGRAEGDLENLSQMCSEGTALKPVTEEEMGRVYKEREERRKREETEGASPRTID